MELRQAVRLVASTLAASFSDQELTMLVRERLLSALLGKAELPLDPQALLDDPPESVYQRLLGLSVCRGESGEIEVRETRSSHRASGAYYTGDAIVQYMLARAQVYFPGATSVLDPACGAGAFLGAASREFGSTLKRVVGLDLDPVALRLCHERVPSAELQVRDALLSDYSGGFDLCLGNPPYISSGLRGAPRCDPGYELQLRKRFTSTAQYKLNTYPLFVELGLAMLREGGVLGYILPDSFLSGRYFEGLRRLLLSNTILELTMIRQDFWEYGRVGQSVILFVRKGHAPPGHGVLAKISDDVRTLDSDGFSSMRLSDLVWGPGCRFRLIPDVALRTAVHIMETTGGRPLGDLLKPYSGLIGVNGQKSLLRSNNAHLQGPWGRLIRSGAEIDRYRLNWNGEEVCLDPTLIKSGGRLAYYQAPKLLLRQTSDSLRAVYDDQGYYCLNNVHVLVPSASVPGLRVFLAILNSRSVDRYYRAVAMETGRLYPQVDLDILRMIPIPPIPEATAYQITVLVRQRENATSREMALLDMKIDDLVALLYGLSG